MQPLSHTTAPFCSQCYEGRSPLVIELLNSAGMRVNTKQEISEEVFLDYTELWWECWLRLNSASPMV